MQNKVKGKTGRWLVPAAFVVAAGLVITGLYTGLKDKVKAQEASSLLELRQQVVPGADSFEPVDLSAAGSGISDKVDAIYLAKQDGQTIGILFQAEDSGHEGPIVALIGVDAQTLTLTGVRVTESDETLGLGDGLSDPAYYQQFVGLGGPDSQLQVYAAGDLPEETTAGDAASEETTAGADGESSATPEETTAGDAASEETTAGADGASSATPEETTAGDAASEETTAGADGASSATPEETTAGEAGGETAADADSAATNTDNASQTLVPVEALSQATVSSKALVRAINACLNAADILKEGGWLK